MISSKAAKPNGKPPILFVHGAWHGAWCWQEHYFDHFNNAGFDCFALDLRGHGSAAGTGKMRWNTIGDYVEDVAEAARACGGPPIIIAHSMGGFVLQHYLQQHPAAAAVLMTPVPWLGVARITARVAFNHPLKFAKANALLSLWPLVEDREIATRLFFSDDFSSTDAARHTGRLCDESYTAFVQMLCLKPQLQRSLNCPAYVLAAENDRIISIAEHESTARRYGIALEVIDDAAHDLMLDTRWQAGADSILRWLAKIGQ